MKIHQRVIRIKIRCSHHRDLVGSVLFNTCVSGIKGFPNDSAGKETAYQCRRCGFNPWVRKIPWRRKWQLSLIIYGFIKALLCTCCFVTPSGSRDTPRGDGEEVGCRKEKKFSQGCCMGLSTFLLSW